MHRVMSLILIVIIVWGSDGALSQPITHQYFGVGVYQSTFDSQDVHYQEAFLSGSEAITLSSNDDDDTGWQLVYGYQFRKHWGVEAQLFDSGDFVQAGPRRVDDLDIVFFPGTDEQFFGSLSFNGQTTSTNNIRGFSIVGTAVWPVTQGLSVKGKLGLGFVNTTSDLRITSVITEQDIGDLPLAPVSSVDSFEITESDVPIIYGLEANYKIGWKWGIGAFWHRMQGIEGGELNGETDVDMAGVQVLFNY